MTQNIVQSQLMMAQAFGDLTSAISSSKTMQASARDAVTTIEVPTAVGSISVDGVTTAGDGQAGLYVRVSADPGAVEKVQSADGAWFELAPPSTLASAGTISAGTSIQAGTSVTVGTSLAVGTTISAGGAITGVSLSVTTFVNATTQYRVGGTKVLGAPIGAWETPTGALTRTTFNSSSPTLDANEVGSRLAQLIIDLKTHGLLTAA